jgi:hypothetical protein
MPFLWWYSEGAQRVYAFIKNEICSQWKKMGILVLLKSLMKPMYGLNSQWDVLISALVRLGHFGVISLSFLIIMGSFILIFIFYLFFPLVIILNLIFQIS